MNKKLLQLFPILLLLAGCAPKQAMNRQNVSHWYVPQSSLAYDWVAEHDSLRLFVQLPEGQFSRAFMQENVVLRYVLRPDYESEETLGRDSVQHVQRLVQQENGQTYLDLKLPVQKLRFPGLLLFHLGYENNSEQLASFDLPLHRDMMRKKFVLLDATTGAPAFRNYMTTSGGLLLSFYGVPQPVTAKLYVDTFVVALPPMNNRPPHVPPTLPLLQATPFRGEDTIRLSTPGLYLLDAGASGSQGLLVQENNFPEITTARELIQPLIYLTTSQERNELYKALDPKVAVDRFWLEIAGNKELGRQLIRTYYGRVTATNRLFTSHKPGWQTDRGMIYIIFGQPDKVYRYNNREEWQYSHAAGGNGVKFIFTKKANTFTHNHYELVRDPGYDLVWYSTVEQWRKGTILR